MEKLPFWELPPTQPAVHDVESVTVLEQTGKLYLAMNELIDEHNTFIENITKTVETYKDATNDRILEFKHCITDIVSNYTQMLDTKIQMLEAKITELPIDSNLAQRIDELEELLQATIEAHNEHVTDTDIHGGSDRLTEEEIQEMLATAVTSALGGEY